MNMVVQNIVGGGGAAGGGATKEFIVHLVHSEDHDTSVYNISLNDWPLCVESSTGFANTSFYVPNDFTSTTDIVMVVIPDATETINWSITTDFGATGEARNANSDSDTSSQAVTINLMSELDVSAAFTDIAAGDHAALQFNSDTTNIRMAYLRVRYS